MVPQDGFLTPAECLPRVPKAGLVDGHNRLRRAKLLERQRAYLVAHAIFIPDGLGEQALHAVGSRFAGVFGQLPTIFALDMAQHALHKVPQTLIRLWSGKVAGQTRVHLQQGATPTHYVRKGRQQW